MFRWARYTSFVVMAATLTAQSAQDAEQKVSALLARMTLDEKLGQMSQSTSMKAPLSAEIKDQIRKGRWGSFLNAAGPEERAEAQRIARKESRLGIPLLSVATSFMGIEPSSRFRSANLQVGIPN